MLHFFFWIEERRRSGRPMRRTDLTEMVVRFRDP
jgi:hypothetical protein